MPISKSILTREDVRMVAPALDKYTQDRLLGDVWKRPSLVPRDRSIITLSALIARGQTIEMPYHLRAPADVRGRASFFCQWVGLSRHDRHALPD